MLSLTKKTEYALIALTHMVRHEGALSTAREISAAYHVSLPLLMNVLKALTQQGMIRSVRGAHGGYTLALPAQDISLLQLIEVIEGPVRFVQCVSHEAHDCRQSDGAGSMVCEISPWCPVKDPVKRVHHKFNEFLLQVKLSDIAHPAADHRLAPAVV